MEGAGFDAEAVAEGLWRRLRDVLLAERRLEGFEFFPESPSGSPATRLAALAADERAVAALARDLALRSLGALADGVNFRILSAAHGSAREGRPALLTGIAEEVGLAELAVAERVHALAQVGLAARDVENRGVVVTAAGRDLVVLVQNLAEALRDRLARGLPALLAS